jgi:hypothetical protein
MVATFDEAGVRFKYPESWPAEREPTENGWAVTLQSPDTAFLLVALREDLPEPGAMAASVLDDLRGVFPEIEPDPMNTVIAGRPAVGYDVRFFSLDITNTAKIRCLECDAGTLLILFQCEDRELETCEPVFEAVCASLELDDE